MRMQEIREKARMIDLKSGRVKKADLIRAIQSKEGNSTCFATGKVFCDQLECCWRGDCLTHQAVNTRVLSSMAGDVESAKVMMAS